MPLLTFAEAELEPCDVSSLPAVTYGPQLSWMIRRNRHFSSFRALEGSCFEVLDFWHRVAAGLDAALLIIILKKKKKLSL